MYNRLTRYLIRIYPGITDIVTGKARFPINNRKTLKQIYAVGIFFINPSQYRSFGQNIRLQNIAAFIDISARICLLIIFEKC